MIVALSWSQVNLNSILLGVISATGGVIVALIARAGHRVGRRFDSLDDKVDGIQNGTGPAIAAALQQQLRDRAVRDLYRLPMTRIGDTPPAAGDDAHLSRSPDEIAAEARGEETPPRDFTPTEGP